MQVQEKKVVETQRASLGQYTRLTIAFLVGLLVLSLYQHLKLYFNGVLDSFLNKSFFTLLLHQLGFTALIALLFAFPFSFLENLKPQLGLKVIWTSFITLLIFEALLIEFFVTEYYALNYFSLGTIFTSIGGLYGFLFVCITGLFLFGICYFTYKNTLPLYKAIGKMYPFTIVAFSLFIAILLSSKKPINENKVQHLGYNIILNYLDVAEYKGDQEYPLAQLDTIPLHIPNVFKFKEEKPNITFIVVNGLGSDFVGEKAVFKSFAPNINILANSGLTWKNYFSNVAEPEIVIPNLLGSLPFGDKGFSYEEQAINRNTLFSILKDNGYVTHYNTTANLSLNRLDKFLVEEHIDHLLDKRHFDMDPNLKNRDGYSDEQLFVKWEEQQVETNQPQLNIFYTSSTSFPYNISKKEKYEQQTEILVNQLNVTQKHRRIIKKNKDFFSSVSYTDQVLYDFMEAQKKSGMYQNTIYIITGSHNYKNVTDADPFSRYKVPFIIYSPLLKNAKAYSTIASHADVAPTLIQLLKDTYHFKTPKYNAWTGSTLFQSTLKKTPFIQAKKSIKEMIVGNYAVANSALYHLKGNRWEEADNDSIKKGIDNSLQYFNSINKYVTKENKLLPATATIYPNKQRNFTKEEIVWINSVFNGENADEAYIAARELAFDGDKERALLLCSYILAKVPAHVDTEVLKARIYGWNKDYHEAEYLLKATLNKYPTYIDAYNALCDVYYWAEENEKTLLLEKTIKSNQIYNKELFFKLERARNIIKDKKIANTTKS